MSYVIRVAAAVFGLFLILLALGILSKGVPPQFPLAGVLLGIVIAGLTARDRKAISPWRLLVASIIGGTVATSFVLVWVASFEEIIMLGTLLGVVAGLFAGGGTILLVAAVAGPRAPRLARTIGVKVEEQHPAEAPPERSVEN
jgi:hypothetical protein